MEEEMEWKKKEEGEKDGGMERLVLPEHGPDKRKVPGTFEFLGS